MVLMLVGVALLVEPQPANSSRTDNIELPSISFRSAFLLVVSPKKNIPKPTGIKARTTGRNSEPGLAGISSAPEPVVLIVNVALEAVEPFSVTVAGLKEQDVKAGLPLQAKVIALLKPPIGVRLKVYVAGFPAATSAFAGVAVIPKSGGTNGTVSAVDVDVLPA